MRPCPRALVVAGGRFPPGRAEVTLVGLQVMPGQPIVAWVSTNLTNFLMQNDQHKHFSLILVSFVFL